MTETAQSAGNSRRNALQSGTIRPVESPSAVAAAPGTAPKERDPQMQDKLTAVGAREATT